MSEYDSGGNRTALKALVNGAADFWNEYYYDDLNRMTSVEQHSAALPGAAAVADKRIDFTYNAAGQWNTITRYEDLIGSALVATSTYVHDNAGRLTALTHAQNTNILADYDWAYDVANRITSFTNGLYSAESATYSYDDTNQLTGADRSGTTNDEGFTYDANGNRTMTGYATGDNNQLTSDGVYNYEYDDEGNRTKRILLVSGSPTGATTEYTWDHRNRLTKITERTSPTGSNTAIYDYVYDLWGRRIAKLLDTDADSDYDEETHYLLDGERYERGNAGDHIVLTFNANEDLTNRYLHGPAIDQILADEQIDDILGTTVTGEVLWPLADKLGTIRDVAEFDSLAIITTVANHREYDVYGNINNETNPAVDNIFAFTGRELDETTGLQDYRARAYDVLIGRFISEDPLVFWGGDSNLQRYVRNHPVSGVDPSGLLLVGPPNEDGDVTYSDLEEKFTQYEKWLEDFWRAFEDESGPKLGINGSVPEWCKAGTVNYELFTGEITDAEIKAWIDSYLTGSFDFDFTLIQPVGDGGGQDKSLSTLALADR
jgi:RHS repeat-associated protein